MAYLISLLISLLLVTPALADKAYFVAPWVNGSADLDIEKVAYEKDGNRTGGWVVVSYCPDSTVVVLVHTSEAYLATLKADPKYIWVETVDTDAKVEEEKPPVEIAPKAAGNAGLGEIGPALTTDMTAPLTTKEKSDIKKVLKDTRKMKDEDINKLILEKRQDLKTEMLKIHKLTVPEYSAAGIN